MKTVAIIYGWSEGPWQSKLLRAALRKHGFGITNNTRQADIIIAHSAGCYLVPPDTNAKLIMLVGLPLWQGRHPVKSLVHKVKNEPHNSWWYKKSAHNIFYLLTRPRQNLRSFKGWRRFSVPVAAHEAKVLAIRNKVDHFLNPEELAVLAKERGWKEHHFSGHHDDIWLNPEPYVAALEQNLDSGKMK